MRQYIKSLVYYAVTLVLMTTMWSAFCVKLGYNAAHIPGMAVRVAGDMMLVLLPYWFLSPRWRSLVLIPLWSLWLWLTMNICYWSFWGDIFNASVVFSVSNFSLELLNWGIRMIPWEYVLFFCILLLFTLSVFKWPTASDRPFQRDIKALAIEMSVIMFLFSQASFFLADYKNNKAMAESVDSELTETPWDIHTDNLRIRIGNSLTELGPVGYTIWFVSDLKECLTATVELNDEMRGEISDFLSEYTHDYPDTARFDGNLVFVIVESLNSEVVGREINGFEITPTLNRLVSEEGVVYIPKVVTQTLSGNSSDGHILLLSGLLPINNGVTAMQFGSNICYPSLAKVLPDHSKSMVLAEDGSLWNEIRNFESLGMGIPVKTYADNPDVRAIGRDAWMFRQALNMIDTIRRPFFIGLETMSMHTPFMEDCLSMP